jgi:alanine dehydrogenase
MSMLLREAEVREFLPITTAIEAVEDAFSLLSRGEAVNCPRHRGSIEGVVLNVMWTLAPTLGAMGVKSYPIVRTDVTQGSSFTFLLYGLPDGQLDAIIEADALGQRRTGAASAVATKYLARTDSEVLAVFGAGWRVESQVEAVAQVLPHLRRVLVVGRSPGRRDRFIAEMRRRTGLSFEAADPQAAVRNADVLITSTGSSEPVFDGAQLAPGTHINAVGSNLAQKRELDAETLHRSNRVVVDSAEVAHLESGDLLINGFDWNRLEELGPIVAGPALGREADEITVFESHGLALEDLACAVRVCHRARELAIGVELPV